MKKGLVKYFSFFSLLFMLLFSFCFSSFAIMTSNTCRTPYYYMFMVLLRSLNLPVSGGASVQWADAYEGYLEATNNVTMLNKLEKYKALSWDDTISDISPLFESLYNWVSLSPSYGKLGTKFSTQFDLPSSPDPLPSSIGMEGVQSTPFSDVNIPSDVDGYTYLWSDAYLDVDENGREICVRRNIYVPDDVEEVVSSFSTNSTTLTGLTLYFYPYKSGREAKSISTIYYMDTYSVKSKDNSFSDSFTIVNYSVRSIMNLPFYVFPDDVTRSRYRSTGVPEYACTSTSASLWYFERDRANDFFLDTNLIYCNEFILPSEYSASTYFKKYSDEVSFLSAMKDCGLDITDKGSYTLEIYKEDTKGNFVKTETETLPGGIGRTPYIVTKTYSNFSLREDLTTPKNGVVLEDGSLIIKMYYERDRIDYFVKHYKQDKEGKSWIREGEETLIGLFESEATFTPKTYSGFTFSESLTEPDNKILSDSGLVIKVYYLRNLISYTIEHYQQDIADKSGKQDWTLVDQDFLSGLFESEATFTPKTYSGFTYDSSLTDSNITIPADDRTLTIKLYYTRNPVEYVIEHYTQDLIKQNESSGWTLADREVLTGTAGMQADCTKKNYAGLMYNSSLTEPADRRILPDGSLVIKMYYTQDLFGFLKEPLDTAVGKILVLSAALLPFSLIALFSIKFFKRIISKA